MELILVIRFTGSDNSSQISDLEIPLSFEPEIDDINELINSKILRATIRTQVPGCSDKRLRLIYNGRVINQFTDFKREIIQPTISTHVQKDLEPVRIYIHCLIAEKLTVKQLEEEHKLDNHANERTTGPDVIGFDRLLSQGFSTEDISDLRRQFHQIYGNSASSGNTGDQIEDLEENEREQRHIRELEERWIDSTVNASDMPRGSPTVDNQTPTVPSQVLEEQHNNEDLLLGLLIGFFLGVVSILFIVADNTVFNKRQKMAIIAGVSINYCFAIIRGRWI